MGILGYWSSEMCLAGLVAGCLACGDGFSDKDYRLRIDGAGFIVGHLLDDVVQVFG